MDKLAGAIADFTGQRNRIIMRRRERMMEDLDRDIREHIAMETQDNIERGMSPGRSALCGYAEVRNVTRVKEETREVWGFVWLEGSSRRYPLGLRMLRKSPGSPPSRADPRPRYRANTAFSA